MSLSSKSLSLMVVWGILYVGETKHLSEKLSGEIAHINKNSEHQNTGT